MDIQKSQRLESLDALRGFDMMFIMGFAGLLVAICELFPSSGLMQWLSSQMTHVSWDGFHHHDSIFPLFLFIAGCSFPYSYAKQIASGATKGKIFLRALKRCLVLVLFGLICNGLFNLNWASLRVFSVLGRIGLAWFGAAVMYIYLPRVWRIGVSAAILLGYSLLTIFVGAPDFPDASHFSIEGNIACWLDRTLFANHIYRPLYDPEGLLSTLPAVVTASIGMLTGELLRSGKISQNKKCLALLIGGVAFVGLGLLWDIVTPINKALWSSSFVCLLAGYSMLNLLVFYWIMDVKGHKKWAFFFKVIGMNSITIYMAMCIIPFDRISRFFFGGLASLCSAGVGSVIIILGIFLLRWLLLFFLYKKKVFLKV